MIETGKKYPAYRQDSDEVKQTRVMLSLTYEQVLEIANVMYYVNKYATGLFGIKMSVTERALHKAVHDAAINCGLSIEAKVANDRKETSQL